MLHYKNNSDILHLVIKMLYNFNDSSFNKYYTQGAVVKIKQGISFDWSGDTVVLNTAASVICFTLFIEKAPYNQYFTVFVDGQRLDFRYTPQNFDLEKNIYKISVNLAQTSTPRKIEFCRQTQADEGYATLISVETDSQLLEIKKPAKSLVEFLGDSITCGHGNIGNDGTPQSTDATLGYAFMAARELGLNYRIRSKSGIGIAYSCGGNVCKQYSWIGSYSDQNPWRTPLTPYNVSEEATVVCIYLGTNDCAGYHAYHSTGKWGCGSAEINEFSEQMKRLINIVKQYNKSAKIVWLCGGMTGSYTSAAAKAVEDLGGNKNGYYLCNLPLGLTNGGQGHPNANEHKIIKETLIEFLKKEIL